MSELNDEFRDSISTIKKDGHRNWLFPKRPKGWYTNARTILSVFYLIVFLILPWIKVEGDPLFLLNVLDRKFILFGKIFWPQDFFIFMIGMLTFIVFIVVFTVAFGRLFCGWVCPQTIFMEMVFRKIEYWIEGDGDRQRKLNNSPWNSEKILRRGGKHFVFFLVSFIIANYFLSYFVGMDHVVDLVHDGPFSHLDVLIPLLIFTSIFFGVYSWFREQVCLIVCPYGRLQGVMLDKDSVVVAYDYVRGEPRKHFRKNEERKEGNCVDCLECVKVCPTGIDIRNGTQLECINCTACIDACDAIMDKFEFPQGLIRYASENNIAKNEKLKFTKRMIAYSVVLCVLIGVLTTLLVTRQDISATVLRARGMMYQEQPNNQISNLYNIQLLNKTRKQLPVTLKLEDGFKGTIKMVGNDLSVKRESVSDGMFFVYADRSQLHQRKNTVEIGVYSGGKKVGDIKTTFFAPNE
jgi:cytochrome c oxidase accessory protein FixG